MVTTGIIVCGGWDITAIVVGFNGLDFSVMGGDWSVVTDWSVVNVVGLNWERRFSDFSGVVGDWSVVNVVGGGSVGHWSVSVGGGAVSRSAVVDILSFNVLEGVGTSFKSSSNSSI
jgi:hypothetical protein